MQTYDYIMIAVLVAATIWGAVKGLAWQVASLLSLVLSYILAFKFGDQVSAWINQPAPWNKFLAMFAIYLATSIVVWLGFRFVKEAINKIRLKEFDRQIGAIFGLAKGVLLCVVITFFAVSLPPQLDQQIGDKGIHDSILRSKSGLYIAKLLHSAEPIMPDEIHVVIGDYMKQLEQELEQGQQNPFAPEANAPLPPLR